MVLAPDSMNTYLSIQQDIGKMKGALGRIEGMLSGFGEQRQRAHEDHVACRAAVDKELDDLTEHYKALDSAMSKLITWGKALGIVGTVIIVSLAVLNGIMVFT